MKTHFILRYQLAGLSIPSYFQAETPGSSTEGQKYATKFESIDALIKAYDTRADVYKETDKNLTIIRVDTKIELVEKEVVTETVIS